MASNYSAPIRPVEQVVAPNKTDNGQCTYLSGKYYIHSKTITYVHYMLYLAGFKARRTLTLNLPSSYLTNQFFSNIRNINCSTTQTIFHTSQSCQFPYPLAPFTQIPPAHT